ncbi:MAG: carbamoyl-phosphate synthase large subunit, partial [Defluviitaleaceae bacterium]|nr:carbamoyl-phosphate synthase large subunit [Defluviitaleaceae bacterium]
GWKEIEFEAMRDKAGNSIAVCSMENLDPVGIHTGDSIVVAPAVTLAQKEFSMLRGAALAIIEAIGVEGGCNIQFALEPNSFEYAVIEVNPRVSRSSALASKATGYPIAKVSVKTAIGYTLDEIKNEVTGCTYAAYEPALDYIAVKFPKWPFDKFVYAKRDLGTQMKATGEVMAIADTFEAALLKAVRGAELGTDSLNLRSVQKMSDGELRASLRRATDERLFVLYEYMKRGGATEEIFELTKIDKWFLYKIENILAAEKELAEAAQFDALAYGRAKRTGFTDRFIKEKRNGELNFFAGPVYKTVDTCAGSYSAATPYFYAVYGEDGAEWENEAEPFVEKTEKVMVLGSGPIRIGQGIEFDYACVHCVWALKRMGYSVIIVNNNPETVSTDFDTADRLYFEPLTIEDVMHIHNLEKPIGVVVAFGGGTAIKLTQSLHEHGVKILGTSADSIDICEDRERFDRLLADLNVKRPRGFAVNTAAEALSAASELGYPVLLRPSYVLGGQNMIIAYSEEDVTEYMGIILRQKHDNPVLIDMYIQGIEVEVDSICDGENIFIPGIMEHIERTGVHSGDSIAMYPANRIDDAITERLIEVTKKLCIALQVKGLVNIQFVVAKDRDGAKNNIDGEIYVIEVNPRASRTVPYISKITGVPMCDVATRVSLGAKLPQLGYTSVIAKTPPYTAVKAPVFSFEKLIDLDTQLGPEMKSTGEVLGIGKNLAEALYKALLGAGYAMRKAGGVFLTVRNDDRHEVADIAKKFASIGFELYATDGTAEAIRKAGLKATVVNKIHECADDNSMTLLASGKVQYIVSTSAKGRDPARDSVKIRRKACALGIPCLTSLDTAHAVADSLLSRYSEINTELVDINSLRSERMELGFIKMQTSGNDYIYIDCIGKNVSINSPESLSVFLSDRHYGVGGDGVVLVGKPKGKNADAGMRIFNRDGSEGSMGGNPIRCVAKLLYDKGYVRKKIMRIETPSGVKTVEVFTQNGTVYKARVDMGRAEFEAGKVPVVLPNVKPEQKVIDMPADIDGAEYRITCCTVGNPHCVIFCGGTDNTDVKTIGPMLETHPMFPNRANIEFVQVLNRRALKVRVWERGSGETLACGTGACAAAAAAVICGYCDEGDDIRVIVPGGELVVRYTGGNVQMTGDCRHVFEGNVTF